MNNIKKKKEYKMLQLPKETHELLKSYCNHHHFIMGQFVSALIKQYIANNKRKQYEEDLYNQSRKHPGWSN